MNKTMNKKLYLGLYAASLGLAILALILAFLSVVFLRLIIEIVGMENVGVVFTVIIVFVFTGVLQFGVMHMVFTFLILAKMWGSIQDGYARATPGEAIGYLFVPFYNLYWVFQAWGGFPEDYNSFVNRHRLQVSSINSSAFSAYPSLTLLSLIPFLGILPAIINLFVFYSMISATCDAVNALAEVNPDGLNQVRMNHGGMMNPLMTGV